jgi:MFS family permease
VAQASEEFGVGQVTESLATGIFLIGFGIGGLFSGPISETVGRNPVYIVTLSIYMIWISEYPFLTLRFTGFRQGRWDMTFKIYDPRLSKLLTSMELPTNHLQWHQDWRQIWGPN